MRLEELCTIKGGKRIPKGKSFSDVPTQHAYIRVTNMKSNTILCEDLKYIDEDVFDTIKNYTISKDDIYLTIAGTIGAVGIVPIQFNGMNLTENAAKLTDILVDKEFLMYALLSTESQNHFSSQFHQVAQPKLSIETASSTMLPLPPIEEQFRIVDCIKKFLSQLTDLETYTSNLKKTITLTKSKILDLAMQGKLVLQNLADEPAADMLQRINPNAKIITDNPHSWNVPTNWAICKLGDTVKIRSAKRVMKSDWRTAGVPFYRTREIVKLSENGTVENELFISDQLYDDYREKYGIPIVGDIMITAVGTIGKTYIVRDNDKFYYKDASVLCITPYSTISSDFLTYLFKAECLKKQLLGNSKGTTVDTITIEKANSYIIAIPPLNEQERIVAKIEELYSTLDEIEASLRS